MATQRKLQLHVDVATCAECGGACCQRAPGWTIPADWGAPDRAKMQKQLVDAFGSGNYAIDWWDGDPRIRGELSQVYIVRPGAANDLARLYNPSWGGACVLHRPNGCSMEHDARPFGCRALVPNPQNIDVGCHAKIDNRAIARLWIPYQAVIKAAADNAGEAAKESVA